MRQLKKYEVFESIFENKRLKMFTPFTTPLIGYHGNNEWPILKLLILSDDLYIAWS